MIFQPHPYQQRAAQWVLDKPRCALWLDPGLGKTGTTLAAIRELYDDFAISKVLIVAPLRVAVSTWPAEIEKWQVCLDYVVLNGAKWKKAAESNTPIHIVNYEKLITLIDHLGKRFQYDMIVLDESSKMKAHTARRFKEFRRALAKLPACRLVELTGTPAANGLHDLWAQMALIDPSLLGKTITQFRSRWFDSDYMGYKYTPKVTAEQEIHDRLRGVCLSMSAADYLSLPDRIENTVEITLPPALMRQYQQLEKDMLLQLVEHEVVASNAAVLTGKCLQFTSGALYDEEQQWHKVHDIKLDALDDLVEELSGNPLLVAYNYQHERDRLQARFPQAKVLDKNPATIDRWNAGEIPILLAHPASAGHGLNLQAGGHTLCWFGLTWSLENYAQFNARLHRQGQGKPVIIHHLITKDTIDERVLDVLAGKATVQQALLDALKERNP